MCFQVSDVTISASHIRRAVLMHALLSFVYNTTILALALNLVVGLVGWGGYLPLLWNVLDKTALVAGRIGLALGRLHVRGRLALVTGFHAAGERNLRMPSLGQAERSGLRPPRLHLPLLFPR